ncbi:DUF998 domain-containing protein [Alteromonas sp. McT4-15]|uniref:DUF998 domain-containing protein n=1 Tax=Alteromonas sp. McT4-15 TaxID=2881256 RepID=UPI001CF8B74A|nr:DUF998 domain-containing protein [Alteromonas sp. McT4-15]MCB4436610.1 DUF998 domain-containing protein [Alteromonas sp. McT4-15]
MVTFLSFAGILASIWIVLGIYIASRFYPNYSHSRQFCSELGAFGSPTQTLSPAINNYPLGILFVLYGAYVSYRFHIHVPTLFIGLMIIVHGIGTWICGIYPMDADPYTTTPSKSSKIHTWSGLIMLISFIIAPAIVAFSSVYPTSLRLISVLCITGCFYYSFKLAKALEQRTVPGLYQRLSYGFQILWLFVYSLYVVAMY